MFPGIEYIKTIINGMKFWTEKKLAAFNEKFNEFAEKSVANWSQNDSESPDYIKNRTHYVLGNDFVDIVSGAFAFSYGGNDYVSVLSKGKSIVAGETYKVIWNGSEYVLTGKEYNGRRYIGNVDYGYTPGIRPPAESDDAPFLIVTTENEPASYTIKAFTSKIDSVEITLSIYSEIVHQLEDKFIPESIARAEDLMYATNPVGSGSISMNAEEGQEIGYYSSAFNTGTASGDLSHAEGSYAKASGYGAHAEGEGVEASGRAAHAEGANTVALGDGSHTEGSATSASGRAAHAEGTGTMASSANQHVQGTYNVEDASGKYSNIVGGGSADRSRANIHTLDWNGVPWFKGRPQFGGTAQDDGSQTVMANGDSEIILKSSGGKKFRITVDDTGTLSATEVTS